MSSTAEPRCDAKPAEASKLHGKNERISTKIRIDTNKTDMMGISSKAALFCLIRLRDSWVDYVPRKRPIKHTNLSRSRSSTAKPSFTQPSRELRAVFHPSQGLGTSQGCVTTSHGLSHESLRLPILIAPSHCPVPACRGEQESHWPK
jgi:hypothetical protein